MKKMPKPKDELSLVEILEAIERYGTSCKGMRMTANEAHAAIVRMVASKRFTYSWNPKIFSEAEGHNACRSETLRNMGVEE